MNLTYSDVFRVSNCVAVQQWSIASTNFCLAISALSQRKVDPVTILVLLKQSRTDRLSIPSASFRITIRSCSFLSNP